MPHTFFADFTVIVIVTLCLLQTVDQRLYGKGLLVTQHSQHSTVNFIANTLPITVFNIRILRGLSGYRLKVIRV